MQVFLADSFELAHDEAYYWLYSKNLDWGYFDHPPMVALIIKMFSFLPTSELTVRLGFITLQFLCLFCLFRLTPLHRRSLTTVLYFSFPLASFVGLLALPDMPLLFMTSVYCLLLKQYLEDEKPTTPWALGICIALLLMAKYHGILLVFFTLLAVPRLFLRKSFYLVTVVALIGCLPHFIWQYKSGFLTLMYHFVERPSSVFSFNRTVEYLGIQTFLAGLFIGPLCWWITIKIKTMTPFDRCMKFISIGTVLFFLLSTFSKKVEANWTVFLAVPLIILTVESKLWDKKWIKSLLYLSFTVVILARFLFIAPETLTVPKRISEFKSWKTWSQQIAVECSHPILANNYQMASKLSFYLDLPIHALNYRSRKNQFTLWPKDKSYYQGDEVCYLSDKMQWGGTPILTPEGKTLYLAKELSLKFLESSK